MREKAYRPEEQDRGHCNFRRRIADAQMCQDRSGRDATEKNATDESECRDPHDSREQCDTGADLGDAGHDSEPLGIPVASKLVSLVFVPGDFHTADQQTDESEYGL